MPANLTIGGAEPRPGGGRAAVYERQDGVEWHAVTTFEDGSEEWKSSDPAKEVSREKLAQRMLIKKWLRNEPGARGWWEVAESARAKALESERKLEEVQARANGREAHNRREVELRRLLGTTVRRLGTAINQVVVGERELVKDAMRPAAGGERRRRKKA